MNAWTRWSTGLLACGAASLAASGCLSDDPNMDGVSTMGTTGTTTDGPGSGPGGSNDPTGADTGPTDTGPGETEDETDTDPSGPTTAGDDTTIYDIQMGSVPEGTIVTLTGVVVTSPVQVEDGGVTIQDPMGGAYSGLYLFLFDEVMMGVPLSPGDEITVRGEYTEFFDFSEITVTSADDIMVTGTGTIPEPPVVDPAEIVAGAATAESWESVPVCVEEVTAAEATNGFGDFHIDDNVAVSNFFLFGTDDFLDVLPGTEFGSLCGPLLYNFEEFKIAPRSSDDYDATLVACADAATPATIYELQQGVFNPDDLVLVEDVVVTTPFNFDGEVFWVQDPVGGAESGISVFMPSAGAFVPSPGTMVSLCGAYDEFFDQSQIQVGSDGDVTSGGMAPLPAPEILSAMELSVDPPAEGWEGVLVQVDGPMVSQEADMFGEWQIDGGLIVTPEFFDIMGWPTPAMDTMYSSITGVLTYSFDNYKLAPRDMADIQN